MDNNNVNKSNRRPKYRQGKTQGLSHLVKPKKSEKHNKRDSNLTIPLSNFGGVSNFAFETPPFLI